MMHRTVSICTRNGKFVHMACKYVHNMCKYLQGMILFYTFALENKIYIGESIRKTLERRHFSRSTWTMTSQPAYEDSLPPFGHLLLCFAKRQKRNNMNNKYIELGIALFPQTPRATYNVVGGGDFCNHILKCDKAV